MRRLGRDARSMTSMGGSGTSLHMSAAIRGGDGRYPPAVSSASVLVVCTANICRSPMVEGLLRHRLADAVAEATIAAAGVRATEPEVDPRAVSAISSFGPDLTGHCPRQLTREII